MCDWSSVVCASDLPEPEPIGPGDPPIHDPEELLGLVSRDLRQPVDVRDVIARTVDGSRFEEYKPRWGPSMICGWAQLHGYPVGILGNTGVIYPDSAQKAAPFIQLCNQTAKPLEIGRAACRERGCQYV